MHLSKRLQAVADMVPKKSRAADIGCDHAYVSLYLVQNHIAEKVIAMDVNKGPLQKAKENVEKYGCSDVIDLRLSDGAEKLEPGEADVLLIAGMGGGLVQKILSERMEVVKECKALILQPQSEIANVRKYVTGIGFQIVEEKILIDEGKFYMMFRAEKEEIKAEKNRKGKRRNKRKRRQKNRKEKHRNKRNRINKNKKNGTVRNRIPIWQAVIRKKRFLSA